MKNNRKKFQNLLAGSHEALLLTSETNRRYATGSVIAEGMAVICQNSCHYFTDSRYIEAARRDMPDVEVVLTDRDHSTLALLEKLIQQQKITDLGIEEKTMTVRQYTMLQDAVSAKLFFAQDKLDACRVVKEDWELALIQQAQHITEQSFDSICRFIEAGMTEKQVYARLIADLYHHGADALAFDPIVVSGPNTSMPHGVAGERKLRQGDFITLDFGARYNGYCSDMTRTVALGSVTAEMQRVYEVVLQAQCTAIHQTKAGMPGCQIDAVARAVIEDAGFGAYFGHGYGHCLGLEIHELPSCSPSCATPLPVGAISSAEPGIYLPGQFGVRIEDMVYIEQNGCRNLTRSPKKLIIL